MWANALRASAEARVGRDLAVGVDLRQHARVVGRIDDHRDPLVVLGRRADHRRAADVDVLDDLLERRAARHRLAERVEVHDHEIDRDEARLLHLLARCFGVGRPRMPPWTRGCSVLTRPSRISGAPVKSLTSRTGTPASASACAVPPVDRISRPAAESRRRELDHPGLVRDRDQRPLKIFASFVLPRRRFYHRVVAARTSAVAFEPRALAQVGDLGSSSGRASRPSRGPRTTGRPGARARS